MVVQVPNNQNLILILSLYDITGDPNLPNIAKNHQFWGNIMDNWAPKVVLTVR